MDRGEAVWSGRSRRLRSPPVLGLAVSPFTAERAVPDQNGLVRVAKSRLADLNEERELLTHVVEFYETRGGFERITEHDRELHHEMHQEFQPQEGQPN